MLGEEGESDGNDFQKRTGIGKETKGVKIRRATGVELLNMVRSDNFSAGVRFTSKKCGPKA
jgi:hypothetical protein